MPPFLLFSRPIFPLSRAFLNSSPKPSHPLQFSSLFNMNRNRQRGWFTNQYDTSPSSDSGTPHHPNQGNSSVSVARKNKTEPYGHSHQRGASPGIVENTSPGNSQEKPVVGPRAVSQQMARSSYRGRPFVADSSSESALRGDNSEISHSRKGGWGPNSQMSSLKSHYVPVNRRDQDIDESPESLKNGLPVVSFSIGDTAEFMHGEDRDVDKAEKIELKSGDVLIFGGKSRHIFHGVPSIIPNTAPKFLVDEVNLRPGRLNLTFRKY